MYYFYFLFFFISDTKDTFPFQIYPLFRSGLPVSFTTLHRPQAYTKYTNTIPQNKTTTF